MTFKSKLWKTSYYFVGVFVLMFLFRLIFGYLGNNISLGYDSGGDFFSSIGNLRKNYASEKMGYHEPSQEQAHFRSGQKYEKTATVKSKTSQFEKNETALRGEVKSFNAIVQYEQSFGKKGNRELHMLIGVDPAKFDSFYLAIQKIGILRSMEMTKIDKTNEYKQLNAQKTSLEKNLVSLTDLKSKGGAISDFISLHDKILEIETKMQELGVELGNFDSENEFCTVKFSLNEGATEKKIGLFQRVKIALEWTIKYYAVLIFSVLGTILVAFVILLLIDKLKVITKVVGKLKE